MHNVSMKLPTIFSQLPLVCVPVTIRHREKEQRKCEREPGTLSEMNRGRARCSVPLACFAACGQSAQLECTFVVHPVCYFQLFLKAPVGLG